MSSREPLSRQHEQDVSIFAQGASEPEHLSNALSGQLISAFPSGFRTAEGSKEN